MKKVILSIFLLLVFGTIRAGEPVESLVDGNSAFALEMYRILAKQGGNVFFSPFSISTALAMTYSGARAGTAEEMAQALHFPLDHGELHPDFQKLHAHFTDIQRGAPFQLHIANALWIDQEFELLPEFIRLNQEFYAAHLYLLDFRTDPEASRLRINGWVEDETQGKITDLLAPGIINNLTSLVLTNALYFLAEWSRQFDPQSTRDMDFHVSPEQKVRVPMMFQNSFFSYKEYESLQVLEMTYEGGDLSMFVCLPKRIDGLHELESRLDSETLKEWISRHPSRQVKVFFPKFKTTGEYSLKDHLMALGMKDAFTNEADFSGIEPQKKLYISAVVHKTFIDVDEAGTEAAAATAVVMEIKSALPPPDLPEFRADHPFLYVIRDNQTGTILFMGRLVDPGK